MQNHIEATIEALLSQLTLREKCLLLSGKDQWRTVPIPRLGINSITMTDGPHGVRATLEGARKFSQATSFPTGISMASTWNPELIEKVSRALAEETRALDCDILLGPCVNIIRHPTAGRNFESYSEDPFLAGKIGAAWVKGIQENGVGASLKHFACNNQEDDRFRGSSEIDERTLRELYLTQFEMIVKEANPLTVMCSYNRVNGEYASQNKHLLNEILKGEWGYEGAVISDWGANHTIFESIAGGLDLEMPGPAKYYGELLVEAVDNWQIDEEDINNAVRRILRILGKIGRMRESIPLSGALNTPEHQSLACEVAEEAITLLKNEKSILPLDLSRIKRIAVIGPMANEPAIGGGGSSFVQPPYSITALKAIQNKLGAKIEIGYAQGVQNIADIPIINPNLLSPSIGEGYGLLGEYFPNTGFTGSPLIKRVDSGFDWWKLSFAPLEYTPNEFSVRWSGKLNPDTSGRHILKVENTGLLRVYVDHKLALESEYIPSAGVWPIPNESIEISLVEGQNYDLMIELVCPKTVTFPHLKVKFIHAPETEDDPGMAKALKLAKNSDVALVFAGFPQGYETEGNDRPGIKLTGHQDDLINAVISINPNTIVILYCGSPVEMPWIDKVPAVIEAYYPGMEGGNAILNILTGEINPSGKLTVTFPKRIEDTPAFANFGPGKKVYYGEGIFVGYRYYDQKKIEPLFPFGHGLSYTTFEYDDLILKRDPANNFPIQASFTITNTGSRMGKEIAQLYVSDIRSRLPRPPKELKGFAKVLLQPGETKQIIINLDKRAFAYYDPSVKNWIVNPGIHQISIGASSRDIKLQDIIELG